MITRKLSYVVAVFATLTSIVAHACSCLQPKPGYNPAAGAKHVFIATLLTSSLSNDREWITAKFKVDEILKGDPTRVQELRTRYQSIDWNGPPYAPTSCSQLALSPGTRFLVYADHDDWAEFGQCGPTRPYPMSRSTPGFEDLKRGATDK
jgi:hypothetical protein